MRFPAAERRDALKWPEVNISTPERWVRVIIGVAALALSIVLFADSNGPVQFILSGLLGLSGLDLAVTGALGHCPLYRWLGHVPERTER